MPYQDRGTYVLGIHSVRAAWLADIRQAGLTRPDSAVFRFGDAKGATPEQHRTLLMAVFFGMSMSTLRMWADEPPASYRTWFARRPERLPSIVGVRADARWWEPEHRRYLCRLRDHYGMTVPYAKVSQSGPVPSGDLLDQRLDVEPDDVAAAEEQLVRTGRWEGPWDDVPFYRKASGGERPACEPVRGGRGAVPAVPAGVAHGAAVLRLPLLCAGIAARLMTRIPEQWRTPA